MRPTKTITRPTPTRKPRPTHTEPKHLDEPQRQAGTQPSDAEELGFKGRMWVTEPASR